MMCAARSKDLAMDCLKGHSEKEKSRIFQLLVHGTEVENKETGLSS